jgi:arsenite methyltransferase
MSSHHTRRPNYGVDAPGVIKGLGGGGLACILLTFIVLLIGSPRHSVLVTWIFVCSLNIGDGLLIGAIAMLCSSKFGKPIVSRHLISSLKLKPYETVLDVGCGRGLLLNEAAKYLESGKAIGVDLWESRDQSGNTVDATMANAYAEGVAERIEIKTADMRSLPLEDGTIDVALSSLAIHNLPTREDRARAIEEISRVLKPGGSLALLDLAHTKEYISTLKRLGWSHIKQFGPNFLIFPPVRVVRGTKPGGL